MINLFNKDFNFLHCKILSISTMVSEFYVMLIKQNWHSLNNDVSCCSGISFKMIMHYSLNIGEILRKISDLDIFSLFCLSATWIDLIDWLDRVLRRIWNISAMYRRLLLKSNQLWNYAVSLAALTNLLFVEIYWNGL